MVGEAANRLIYVVDDDEAFRDSLRWLLESAGYGVSMFPNVERFLESYRAGSGACRRCTCSGGGKGGIGQIGGDEIRADAIRADEIGADDA